MPKQLADVKSFANVLRRKDATQVRIKAAGKVTKFKVRCSRYLYTLVVKDQKKVEELKSTIPASLEVVNL